VSIVNTPIARRGKSRERSVFGNATWQIGEATALSGGLRHIWFQDSGTLVVNGATLLNTHSKDEATVYNVSLSHKFSQDFLVYANTGSAFRPGPFFRRRVPPADAAPAEVHRPRVREVRCLFASAAGLLRRSRRAT
jgi:outer membrane receptor protein involved in Fe transport